VFLCLLTGDTARLGGKARKQLRLLQTPHGALDRLTVGGDRRGLAASPQPIDGHAQPQQSEQQESVKPQVVYHLVPLRAGQVNGGIPPMFQARELSAGWGYRTTPQKVSTSPPLHVESSIDGLSTYPRNSC
jgi:hypothetical protein